MAWVGLHRSAKDQGPSPNRRQIPLYKPLPDPVI